MWQSIVAFFSLLWRGIKANWSGIAVAALEYEEARLDAEKQKAKTSSLNAELSKNACDVAKENAGLSDDAIIDKLIGGDTKPKP